MLQVTTASYKDVEVLQRAVLGGSESANGLSVSLDGHDLVVRQVYEAKVLRTGQSVDEFVNLTWSESE